MQRSPSAAATKIQALIRGKNQRQSTREIEQKENAERRAAEQKYIESIVQQKSLFNRDRDRGIWEYLLPRKPTRLFMLDVAYRAIKFDKKAYPDLNTWMLVPSGFWRVVWAYVLLLTATCDVVLCCYSISYCRSRYKGPPNVLIQIFFTVDMLLSFLTAYPTTDASLELRPRRIAIRYMRSSFPLHMVGLLPLELLAPYSSALSAWQALRIFRWFDVWIKHDAFRSVTTTGNDGFLEGVKYFVLFIVVAHVLSCAFLSLAIASPVCYCSPLGALPTLPIDHVVIAIEEHNAFDPINALVLEETSRLNAYNLYVYYLYATVAMLLGDAGAAKTAVTQQVSIIILFVGNITLAIVFSKIILALQTASAARDAYARRMRSMNDAMASQNVPTGLQRRVHRFFEFKFMLTAGLDDPATSYIAELPNGMKVDLMRSLYSEMLMKVPLFKGTSESVISSLAQQLVTMIILPDEIVIKEGCVGNSMYFIRRGLVRIVKAHETPKEFFIGGLGSGSFFGEIALVSSDRNLRRGASVIAATVLSLLRLGRSSLEEVAKNEPGLMMHVRQVAIARRREMGETVRAVGDIAIKSALVTNMAQALAGRRLIRQATATRVLRTRNWRQGKDKVSSPNRVLRSLGVKGSLKVMPPGNSDGHCCPPQPLDAEPSWCRGGAYAEASCSWKRTRAPAVEGDSNLPGEAFGGDSRSDLIAAVSREVTEEAVAWVRHEVGALLHEKLDRKLIQIFASHRSPLNKG